MPPVDRRTDVPIGPDDMGVLRKIVAGTTAASGAGFFTALVSSLAETMETEFAVVAEAVGALRVRPLALRTPHGIERTREHDVANTPYVDLADGEPRQHSNGVSRKFDKDEWLRERGIESFLGVALNAPDGQRLGYLAAFSTRPMAAAERRLAIFRIFAARAQAELARVRVERTLGESEERLRDLFDEAPIAYVHEGLDSRFIRANRAALRILGVKPEEVPHMRGLSLVPDRPDAQRRAQEAFKSIGRGTDTSGVVLELRRKDNGKPVWLQWWSKPDPSGTYTRTMFLDITDRVLMEQEQARLTEQNQYLREEIKSVHNFEEIVGRSTGLLEVLASVDRVAGTDASVLITGETGTGKELIARAIHSSSRRREKPLIKLNCAALPTGLVESELFGHEKGAFSGAIAKRIGRFELAHGGTIFLDEVGELPLDVQVKLLRVLQEREFERIGGNTPISVDVRIIAATNRDLQQAIADGKFRQDLYYRLNVFPVQMPPLRERAEDIPLLVHYFVGRFAAQIGRMVTGVSEDVMGRLRSYPWPGNVRELENIVQRAVILSPGEHLAIGPELLPSDVGPVRRASAATPARDPLEPLKPRSTSSTEAHSVGPIEARRRNALEEVERAHITDVLRRTNWKIEGPTGAAEVLEMNPSTLRSRIKRLEIRRSNELS
jgi:PAS domain S-box-containing protein